MSRSERLTNACLYGFVDAAYLHGREVIHLTRLLCEGGVDIILWRAKGWSAAEVESKAREILKVTRDFNVPLVINDHLQVAIEVGAEICHLGQEDFFDAGHTHVQDLPLNGSDIGIGLSTHAPEQAKRAMEAEPDYIAIGPVYSTQTKPTAAPVTLDYVRWARENAGSMPWFAIGGINEATLNEVLDAGATRVCIVSAILNAADTIKKCKEFLQMIRLRTSENLEEIHKSES